MADVLYTTTYGIRAAIGITAVEVTDDQILDLNIEDQLFLYLEAQYPDHAALALANAPTGSPTAQQQTDWKKLKLLSQYHAAVILLQAGQYLLTQDVAEGGTSTARFARNDLETTLARLQGVRDQFLSSLLGEAVVTTLLLSPLVRGVPSYDPVTGE